MVATMQRTGDAAYQVRPFVEYRDGAKAPA
jgi:hypothetical protein